MTTATKSDKFERAIEAIREYGEAKASRFALKRFKIGMGEGTISDRELCVMQMAYVLAMARKGKTVDDVPTDSPPCVSKAIIRFAINYNDNCDDDEREALRPIIPLTLNTKGDGKSKQRDKLLRRTLTEVEAAIVKHNASVDEDLIGYGDERSTYAQAHGHKPKQAKMDDIAAFLGEYFGTYDADKGRKVLKALCKGQA